MKNIIKVILLLVYITTIIYFCLFKTLFAAKYQPKFQEYTMHIKSPVYRTFWTNSEEIENDLFKDHYVYNKSILDMKDMYNFSVNIDYLRFL